MTQAADAPLPFEPQPASTAALRLPAPVVGSSRESVAELLRNLLDQAREWHDQLAAEATPPVATESELADDPLPADELCAHGLLEVRSRLKAAVGSATRSLRWSRHGVSASQWAGIRSVSAQTCRSLDVQVLLRAGRLEVPVAVQTWRRSAWHGAQIRILAPEESPAESLAEFLVVDDRTLWLAAQAEDGEPGLRRITDPAIVHAMTGAFNLGWAGAAELDETEALFELLDSEVTRAVLMLLIEGVKDESIARTIGISLRTCRRHAAMIMTALTSTSRFQAGYRLGRASGMSSALRAAPPHSPVTARPAQAE